MKILNKAKFGLDCWYYALFSFHVGENMNRIIYPLYINAIIILKIKI